MLRLVSVDKTATYVPGQAYVVVVDEIICGDGQGDEAAEVDH